MSWSSNAGFFRINMYSLWFRNVEGRNLLVPISPRSLVSPILAIVAIFGKIDLGYEAYNWLVRQQLPSFSAFINTTQTIPNRQ